ncbi:MAG TPA: ABC transporter ATP-binding protein [Pyrodictium sp.]|nr:ABC transporter ATP-binding protein [Pyrodictium sp.]
MGGREILVVENVWKRFGGIVALAGVSIEVREGERLAIIGPNGSGKTTLFNVITGYVKPDRGRVSFDGQDITGKKPHQIARLGIARTFQIVKPFANLTVEENVVVAALSRNRSVEEARRHALHVLELVGLYDKRNVRAAMLNLAEKKRLELAKALALNPRLLLLDEVAAGLRPSEIKELKKLLYKINSEGVTIVMVEHVLRAVSGFAERVVVLHHGSKLAEGRPEDIAKDPRVVDAYLGSLASQLLEV